jgi:ATP phosphoribosyltransferase
MTPEERLNQTEKLLETTAKYINRHSQMIEQNQAEISQLRSSLNETLKVVSELAIYQRQTQEEIRRIWEYLLSQSSNGHSGD